MNTRRLNIRLAAILAAVLLVFTTAQPATAAGNNGVVKLRVKSAKQVAGSAVVSYPMGNGRSHNYVVRVVANFSGHTTNSVKLTRFKLCYSQTGGQPEDVSPYIRVGKSITWKGKTAWMMGSGACRHYTVNKRFKAKPKKELFVLVTKLGDAKLNMLHGFYR